MSRRAPDQPASLRLITPNVQHGDDALQVEVAADRTVRGHPMFPTPRTTARPPKIRLPERTRGVLSAGPGQHASLHSALERLNLGVSHAHDCPTRQRIDMNHKA